MSIGPGFYVSNVFIRSFIHPFVRSFIRSLVHSFVRFVCFNAHLPVIRCLSRCTIWNDLVKSETGDDTQHSMQNIITVTHFQFLYSSFKLQIPLINHMMWIVPIAKHLGQAATHISFFFIFLSVVSFYGLKHPINPSWLCKDSVCSLCHLHQKSVFLLSPECLFLTSHLSSALSPLQHIFIHSCSSFLWDIHYAKTSRKDHLN